MGTRILLWLCFVSLSSLLVIGRLCSDEYTVCSPPTINDMKWETVKGPDSTTRTTLGIGEMVDCWIEPGSWQDTDYNVTQSQNESDDMGTVDWDIQGAKQVYIYQGNPYKRTIVAKAATGSITVKATIHDSGNKGQDAALEKTVTFSVVTPSGMNFAADNAWVSPYGSMTENDAGDRIGNGRVFPGILLPTSVTFTYGYFRENIPQQSSTWPNGESEVFSATTYPFQVNADNEWSDSNAMGPHPRTKLSGQAKTFDWNTPLEYQKDDGSWAQFCGSDHHQFLYSAAGKCSIKVICSNSQQSAARGPWIQP